MTRAQIEAEVVAALVQMFELDAATVTPAARLTEDLELDSLDAVDMAARMQEMTGERVPEQALRKIRTVGDVVDQIEQSLRRRA